MLIRWLVSVLALTLIRAATAHPGPHAHQDAGGTVLADVVDVVHHFADMRTVRLLAARLGLDEG